MSWQDARKEADAIFDRIKKEHPLLYIEIVLRALQRRLNTERRREKREAEED